MSSSEADVRAATETVGELLWMKSILRSTHIDAGIPTLFVTVNLLLRYFVTLGAMEGANT